jgi:ABC-2 type transport system ATP-binding protein
MHATANAASTRIAGEVVVEARNLSKVYRDFWGRSKKTALKPLDLDIRRGEIFGLLGPNGSGKTTTLKLLLGLIFPTSGEALMFGRPATDVTKNGRLGYLPEESYLYKFLDAEETLDFYGRLFGMPPAERQRRAAALIEMVGLSRDRKRQLREYSKGMTRRIGVAQALINDPELVLLDEPTSGLDPIGTREMKDLIIDLKHRGKTVIMCSHLLADVEDVCDRIAVLHQGELKELGRVDDLLRLTGVTQIKASGITAAVTKSVPCSSGTVPSASKSAIRARRWRTCSSTWCVTPKPGPAAAPAAVPTPRPRSERRSWCWSRKSRSSPPGSARRSSPTCRQRGSRHWLRPCSPGSCRRWRTARCQPATGCTAARWPAWPISSAQRAGGSGPWPGWPSKSRCDATYSWCWLCSR